jgi:hypothetical protein
MRPGDGVKIDSVLDREGEYKLKARNVAKN